MTLRRALHRVLPWALVLGVVVAACSGKGPDRAAGNPVRSSTTVARTSSTTVPARVLAATTVPGGPAVSTTVPQDCGPLTAADVAAATGVAQAEVRRGSQEFPDAPCVFRAGPWEVATAEGTVEPTTTQRSQSLPSVAGLPGRNYLLLGPDRGGRWYAQAGVLVGARFGSLTVRNDRGGSDTRPPVSGEPQQGPTRTVATELLRTMAGRL